MTYNDRSDWLNQFLQKQTFQNTTLGSIRFLICFRIYQDVEHEAGDAYPIQNLSLHQVSVGLPDFFIFSSVGLNLLAFVFFYSG